jgi:putative redox protein
MLCEINIFAIVYSVVVKCDLIKEIHMEIKFHSMTKFEISNGRHTIISDQPKEAHGTDEGMGPIEILAASLGSCIAVFIGGLLQRRNVTLSDCSIKIDWEMANNPRRVSNFHVNLILPENLKEEDRQAILKAAGHCTVHNTLHSSPEINIDIN